MKESKTLRRNVYIVLMPLSIFASTGLLINVLNNIYVLKAGKTIEATLIKKEYGGTSDVRATFSYNDKTFRISRVQVEWVDTFKMGAALNFHYLDTQPDRFVWTGKEIK